MDQNLIQQFRVQLKQANVARDTEHDLRLNAERQVIQNRGLLLEMAQRLVPIEFDELWAVSDVNTLPNDQLMRWLIAKLAEMLFHYRAMCAGRDQRQLDGLKAALQQRDGLLQQREQELRDLTERLKEIVTLKNRMGDMRNTIETLTGEKAALASDLEASRAIVRQLQSQTAKTADTTLVASGSDQLDTANQTASLDWFQLWQTNTTLENQARQQEAIQLLGRGDAFFRSEIIERLNVLGLTNEPNPDKPTGSGARLLVDLIEQGFMEEVSAGYSAAVPKPLQLTERGCEAFRRLFDEAIEDTAFRRLVKRHKTVEHTALNLLARNLLLRFGFQAIELFPDQIRTTTGSVVDPDLVAVSPAGERLLIECERMTMHRTPGERDAKWSHLAEVTQGRLYVVVFGSRQQSDLIAELSSWIQATQTKKVALSVCQYVKAIKLESPSMWTYTTTWALA
jgi:hypothetical protein